MINLFLPCLIVTLITYRLLFISNNKIDKNILNIMFLGQKILLFSSIFKLNKLIEVSHLMYSITLVIGALFFKEKHNILFILILLLVTLITRNYYNDCLFYLANGHTKIFDIDVNFDYIVYLCIIICLYKLYKL